MGFLLGMMLVGGVLVFLVLLAFSPAIRDRERRRRLGPDGLPRPLYVPGPVQEQALDLAAGGERARAVGLVRSSTGLVLNDAADAVKRLLRAERLPYPGELVPGQSGGGPAALPADLPELAGRARAVLAERGPDEAAAVVQYETAMLPADAAAFVSALDAPADRIE